MEPAPREIHPSGALSLAVAVALACAGQASTDSQARQGAVFRAGIELVHSAVVVTDRRGRLVTDLTAADFRVLEDDVAQEIRYFAAGDGPVRPDLHLGLLLDVSESMVKDIDFTRAAAIKFLNALPDALDITLVDFDAQVRSARFVQADFPRLVERIRGQEVRGFTSLYDAVGLYLDGAAGQDGRKIMLLYSDGSDTRSALRFPELIELLKASDVTVYAIGALEHQSAAGRGEARARLSQIAEATGGQAFFPFALDELDETYAQVLAEVRAQYTLGYASTNASRDGAWRTVEITVRRPDVRVRARRGYYGPPPQDGR